MAVKDVDRSFSRKMDKRRKAYKASFAHEKESDSKPAVQDEKNVGKANQQIRINKYLSDAGVCSRRQADRMMEEGRILVDGKPAVPGQKVYGDQEITVDGRPVRAQDKKVVLASLA